MISTQTNTEGPRDNLAFFTVMANSDLWREFRKYMYPGKKTGNWYTWKGTGDVASFHGYLSLMKCRLDLSYCEHAMDCSANNGHLEVVKFLHENRTEGCTKYAMNRAAQRGNLEVVKFLHFNRTEGCTDDAMDGAAMNGHLEVVKFLQEIGKDR